MFMKRKILLLVISSLFILGCTKNGKTTNSSNSEEYSISSEENPISSESFDPEPTGGYYGGYYGDLSWTNSDDLMSKLHSIVSNDVHPLKYNDPNWETNIFADHSIYDYEYLDVLYNANDIPTKLTNKSWQREHAFCASLMTGSQTSDAVKFLGRATDFHNLFAGDASANGSRGNKNYGFADKSAGSYQDRTVNNGYDGYSFDSVIFEPGNKDKGRVARAIFYMVLMYNEPIHDDKNNIDMQSLSIVEDNVEYISGNNCHFSIGHFSDLLNWATTYDVDLLEMQHNESVYSHIYTGMGVAQNNRNPFVDYPELIEFAFGEKKNQSGKLTDLIPSCAKLHTVSNEFSHYAIGFAKREYTYGDTLQLSDITLYSVNKDFSYEIYNGNFNHSFAGHTFEESDGASVTAIITIPGAESQPLEYSINLDPFNTCSTKAHLTKAGISNTKANVGVDQNVTYDGINFIVNAQLDYEGNNNWTLTNNQEGVEGFKMGSGTYHLTQFTIKTSENYIIDAAYIKAYAANTSSSYSLTIKVGTETIYSGSIVYGKEFTTYGTRLEEPVSGQISFIFSGNNSLSLRDLAFNETI